MLKTLLAATALVAGTSTFALADMPASPSASEAMMHHHMLHHHMRHNHVTADGRCNGRSYGTGQRSCGTATGGTPGGNPSRN